MPLSFKPNYQALLHSKLTHICFNVSNLSEWGHGPHSFTNPNIRHSMRWISIVYTHSTPAAVYSYSDNQAWPTLNLSILGEQSLGNVHRT